MAKQKLDTPQISSSAVMSFPKPPLRNTQEYLKAYSGYPYTAISAIAQEVASINLHLFKTKFSKNKGKPESEEVYEHEILSLLRYVNPLTTFYDIVEATQIYLELTGEAFWIVLKQDKTPKEFWLVRPDWVKIVPSSTEIIDHYTYHPGGSLEKVDIPKDNMIHFKNFNPLNPYRGKGPLQSAALPVDILNFAQEYNRNFFFNSAIPSMVFSTDKNLSAAVIKRFINQWQGSYGGRGKSNKVAFLGNGLKLDTISQGAKELDFTEQQRLMRDDILAVFKVPKSILGLTEDVNRANAEATNKAFMDRTISPRMIKFVGTLNEFLLPMYNDKSLFLDFIDPSPEDAEAKIKYYESGLKYKWLTQNEVRALENLEPLEGGDILNPVEETIDEEEETEKPDTEKPKEEEEEKGLLHKVFGKKKVKKVKVSYTKKLKPKPFKHMMPIPVKGLDDLKRENLEKKLTKELVGFVGQFLKKENIDNLGIKQPTKTEVVKENTPIFTEEAKDAYWKQFITFVSDKEPELRNQTVDIFKEQEAQVMDILDKDVKYWRKTNRVGKAGSSVPSLVAMEMLWKGAWLTILREVYIEQGNYTLNFLGTGANIDVTTETAYQYLRVHSSQLITEINETTRTALMETLAEGYKEGESINALKKRVNKVFKKAQGSRAELIARTEIIRASNAAVVEAYRQSGVVEAKEWLTERDERACPYCLSMDGKIVDLNVDYFKVGDKLTVDGQTLTVGGADVGSPPLHPNCRCTTIPVLLGEKALKEKVNNKK